ncbi:hypothetical protein TIFTF001_000153 [Ficus carica]|uniref:Uncharacterized protein n=1 Tax=Ficus carica TaxID=3494 RepID=A0AA87Z3G6_FICCA|nr:hypothetical protein TIFTF001_000153 [Ficus carica]
MPGKETSSVGELLVVELQPAAVGNRKTVKEFYKALASNDTETISRVVASDLEWWFHGPPHCQHMMRALTGDQSKPLEPFSSSPGTSRPLLTV